MSRQVYKPKEPKICAKCGGSLGFYKNERGNFVPCNLDGTDHWDRCREDQIKGTYGPKYKKDFRMKIWGSKTTDELQYGHYNGDLPPWEFKHFIYCVKSQAELRRALKGKLTYETTSLDTDEIWTDGTHKQLF